MKKKFISILGTGNYAKTKYYWKDKSNFVETHFAQEASIKLICNHFTNEDEIIIFVTDKSEKTNWVEQPEGKNYAGLSAVLSPLNIPLKSVRIPDGNTEDELWQIFETIFANIDNNDELYIDITHSFRSLPMILIVLLNYAKVLKNVQIRSITYGNWEGRDNDNFSPIIDLTPLSELQDWTIAANNFIKYGNAKMLVDLTNKEIQPILKETQGKNEAAADLRTFSKQLKEFSDVISTVRGKKLYEENLPGSIKDTLKKVKNSNNLIAQLNPILEKIEEKLSEFDSDPIKRLYNAVKWCIDHEMYQQAYSFCVEATLTKICNDNNLKIDDIINRTLVNSAVYIKKSNIPFDIWNETCKNNKIIVETLINYFSDKSDLVENIVKLNDLRNDFMHAGFRENSVDAKKLVETINDIASKLC